MEASLDLVGPTFLITQLRSSLGPRRGPCRDLFGIPRGECQLVQCPGYEPFDSLFSEGCRYPSFCRVCECPASSHELTQVEWRFPPRLLDAFTSHKFTQNDLDFNCIVVVMAVQPRRKPPGYISALLTQFLRRCGYTLVASHKRRLLPEEAHYLSAKEVDLSPARGPEDGALSAQSQVSMGIQQLQSLSSLRQKLLSPDLMRLVRGRESIKLDKLQSLGQRLKQQKSLRSQMQSPEPLKQQRTAATGPATRPIDPDELGRDCVILCLDSSLFHHLPDKFQSDLSTFQAALSDTGLETVFSSVSRVGALEDAIMFFPQVFQLHRSILQTKAFPELLPEKPRAFVLNQPMRPASPGEMTPELFFRGMSARADTPAKPADLVGFNAACVSDVLNLNGATVLSSQVSRERGALDPLSGGWSRDTDKRSILEQNSEGGALFAVGKTGFSGLSLPSNLSLSVRVLSEGPDYIRACDRHFPVLSQMQRTVVLFRPAAVKVGLNKILRQLLLVNEFVLLESAEMQLTLPQAEQMAELEAIPQTGRVDYVNLMTDSAVQMLVLFKYGAVAEARALVEGCPEGRRRVATLKKQGFSILQKDEVRQQGAFHPGPFSSISELINLDAYSAPPSGNSAYDLARTQELLAEINYFQRRFNILSFAAPDPVGAEKALTIAFPNLTQVESFAVLLNPIYASSSLRGENALAPEVVTQFLRRMGLKVLYQRSVRFSRAEANAFFAQRFPGQVDQLARIVEHFENAASQLFVLAKPGGLQQIRRLFEHRDFEIENFFKERQLSCFERPGPLLPEDFPPLFFVCDASALHQKSLQLCNPRLLKFSGRSLQGQKVDDVLQHILQVTLGEKLRRCRIDSQGLAISGGEAQIVDLPSPGESKVYAVEAEHHGPFEIRVRWELEEAAAPSDPGPLLRALAGDRFGLSDVQEQALLFRYEATSRFTVLSLYYSAVASMCEEGLAPNFYQFRVMPYDNLQPASRIYETEEFMGEFLLDRIAKDVRNYRFLEREHSGQEPYDSGRGSLAAFLWAQKLAETCQQLERVTIPAKVQEQLGGNQGYGRVVWTKQGEFAVERDNVAALQAVKTITSALPDPPPKAKAAAAFDPMDFEKQYFRRVISRAESRLGDLNSLKQALERVLRCEAYEHSRKVEMLRFLPDRLSSHHLRAKQRLKVFGVKDLPSSFIGDIFVKKPLQTVAALGLFRKVDSEGAPSAMQWSVALSNVDPAIRTKYHLIAAVIWLLHVRIRGSLILPEHARMSQQLVDNMLQAVKQTYGDYAEDSEKEPAHVEGVSLVKMEVFLYGLRELGDLVDQLEKGDEQLKGSGLVKLREAVRALEDWDVLVDPSKLKGGPGAVLIHRTRFFRPILEEKWEDDLKKEKFQHAPREYKFGEGYEALKVVSEDRATALEKDWYEQPAYKKRWLFKHDHAVNEWLAVKKKEAKSEAEYQEVVRRGYLELMKLRREG